MNHRGQRWWISFPADNPAAGRERHPRTPGVDLIQIIGDNHVAPRAPTDQ
jgi:hypothetical protein